MKVGRQWNVAFRVALTAIVTAGASACGGRDRVRTVRVDHEQVRLQLVPLDADYDAEGILAAVEAGGSVDHVILMHSSERHRLIAENVESSIGRMIVGEWYALSTGEPWESVSDWVRTAAVGEVGPLFYQEDQVFLVRLAQRLQPGDEVAGDDVAGLVESLASFELRTRVGRGDIRLRVGGRDLMERLGKEQGMSAEEWMHRGPRWLALARALGSDALGMRVLVTWSQALSRDHQMKPAAAIERELLALAEKHEFSHRTRASIATRLAEQYQHSWMPFEALDILDRQRRKLRGEGLYVVLCRLAELLGELGQNQQALVYLEEADTLIEDLDHVHEANHHLVRSWLLDGQGRLEEAVEAARLARKHESSFHHDNVPVDVTADLRLAKLLLKSGDLDGAAALAEEARQRVARAPSVSGDEHVCSLPALSTLHSLELRRGNLEAVRDLEREILLEARENHSLLTRVEYQSRIAAEMLDVDPHRGTKLLLESMDMTRVAGADHLSKSALVSFMGWTLRTGQHADVAEDVADWIFERHRRPDETHLPILWTPQKHTEIATQTALMDYYIARARTGRAVRVAERIVAANVLRSFLVLSIDPRRFDHMMDYADAVPEAPFDDHYRFRPVVGDSAADARRLRLKRLTESLLSTLHGEQPYTYADALEPNDLFVAYLLHRDRAYSLSFFEGVARVEELVSRGEAPGGLARRLAPEVLELGMKGRWSQESSAAAAALFEILLGAQRDRLARAARLVVSPGPELAGLPFGLLRSGDGYLAERIPIVYVDTGLPMPAPEIAAAGSAPQGPSWVLFADPFGDLPETRAALSGFAESRPEARLYAGSEARESTLWALRGRLRLLHLDTHAEVEDRGRLEQVTVHLAPDAGDSGDGGDGEVALLDWLGRLEARPDMVSVVACRSAVSSPAAGRDVANLGAVLAARGVPWALGTFWRVEDEASACFAGELLERLADGERPDHALHRTIRHPPRHCKPGDAPLWAPYRLSILGARPRGGAV